MSSSTTVREQCRYAESGDLTAFAEADEAFHRAIVEAGNNRLMTDFYATLSDRQRRMSIDALGPTLQQSTTVLNEHQGLISIIENRDRPAFAPALRAHLKRMYRRNGSGGPGSDDGVPLGSDARWVSAPDVGALSRT